MDVVDLVVPPKVTEEVVKQCVALGVTRIWLQPGAESEEAIRFCRENGIRVLYGVCVMAEGWRKNSSWCCNKEADNAHPGVPLS